MKSINNPGGEGKRKYRLNENARQKRSERMRALNADPEFKAAQSERMRALHADLEFNPLAALTPEQRADYDILRKKRGYSRADALAMVLRKVAA